MRRNFFKKMGSFLCLQTPPAEQLSNSVIAFFIEDYLLELEEQNSQIDVEESGLADKHSKALFRNFTKHKDWIPLLTFEVKFQQRLVSILSNLAANNPLDHQIAELEQQIQVFQLLKNAKNARSDTQKLASLIQDYMVKMESRTFASLDLKLNPTMQRELVVKTYESALPDEDLVKFAELNFGSKQRHLNELHLIHTGINVFKNEFEASTKGTENTQNDRKLPFIRQYSEDAFQDKTGLLIELIEEIESKDCNEMDFNDQIYLKLIWQKLIQVKNYIDAEFEEFEKLRNKGNAEIEQLIEAAKRQQKTLKSVIFPIFSELGHTYKSLMLVKRKIVRFFDFVIEFEPQLRKKLKHLPALVLPSNSELQIEIDSFKSTRFKVIQLDSAEIGSIRLAYNGMCLVSLVCDGTLLYGNPSEAIFYDTVRNIYLCFLTREKASEFLKDPEQVYAHVRQALTDYKMLMFLIDYDRLQRYDFFIETVNEEVHAESIKCYNVGIQTPTHFQERFIDHSYFWNEWDLRRQAIKMANIRNKKTIGCQTGSSYFKVNNETQIWPLKEQSTMTEVDKGTNPIWPRNYIVGLRSIDTK